MTQYQRIILNHANLHRPVHLVLGTVAGYHWSDASKSTHVYTTAGIFPATETPEEIDKLIDETIRAKNPEGEENESGTAVQPAGDICKHKARSGRRKG